MLDLLARIDPSDRSALRAALTAHLHAVSAAGPRGDLGVVARVEAEVRADPGAHIRFDPTGLATLDAAGRTFKAGRFETPRLGELRRRAEDAKTGSAGGALRFFVLDGASPATDIGALQATAPEGSLFQVASQFNCLDSHLDRRDPAMQTIVRQLQRAAHLGALTSAAALGKSYAVLTLVGGGVFGNPVPVIWESILWALDAVRPLLHRDLCVALNGYNLERHVPRALLAEAAAARGGALVVFDRTSVLVGEAP